MTLTSTLILYISALMPMSSRIFLTRERSLFTGVVMVMGRVRVGLNPTLTLPITITTPVKRDLSRVRKIRDDIGINADMYNISVDVNVMVLPASQHHPIGCDVGVGGGGSVGTGVGGGGGSVGTGV